MKTLYCLMGARGTPIEPILHELSSKEYNVILPSQIESIGTEYSVLTPKFLMETVPNVINVPIDEVGIIKDMMQNQEVKVISIYLQSDEHTRAQQIAKTLRDQTVLKYYEDYRLVPSIWGILIRDRGLTDVVKADYTINANGSISRTISYIERAINKGRL